MTIHDVDDLHVNPDDTDDEEMDWEEVAVPVEDSNAALLKNIHVEQEPSTRQNIEITLRKHPSKAKDEQKKKLGGISHAERLVRIDCHKVHTVALLTNAWVRNKWLNDPLLQARLLSLTPLNLQNTFATIHKSRIPDALQRGTMFEMAMLRLVEWWSQDFFEVVLSGHLRSRIFDDVQSELLATGMVDLTDQKGKGKGKAREIDSGWLDEGEVVKSEKSLMKHALQKWGSRDVSAQLFTSLCRALGIPARLVVSLQSVPWQAGEGKPKTNPKLRGMDGRDKGKETAVEGSDHGDEEMYMEEVDIVATGKFPEGGERLDGGFIPPEGKDKGKKKAGPVIKLRATRSKGQTLNSSRPLKPPDPTTTPPIFWTEVFSRPDARWLPVDPIRAIVNKRKVFDPASPISSANATRAIARTTRVDNRMAYVLAFEEDGYARDLTPRYAREYGAKVAKAQAGGKGRREWWTRVLGIVTRPYRLHRDDLEDDELAANQITEGMPTTLAGFKGHSLYVLARHLHRDQEIEPNSPELGKFRGEPVYARSAVLSLKTAENWMRRGRSVRTGEQPMKFVKQRASTVGRKREIEVLREAGATADGNGSDVLQGLYAERQTELYRPPPVVDGIIPKNDFGNIDLYVPSMLPVGAAHIPSTMIVDLADKGASKVARQLGFDYAEAVTNFEFKNRRAFPVITGIVVAAENEQTVLEACWEHEHNAAIKEQAKRQEAVIKRWTRLVQGLRIRQRLQEQYAGRGDDQGLSKNIEVTVQTTGSDAQASGGFLTTADDVVQHYSLPKFQHPILDSAPDAAAAHPGPQPGPSTARSASLGDRGSPSLVMETVDDSDGDMSSVSIPPQPVRGGAPKSMAELAALDSVHQSAVGSRASSTAMVARDQPAVAEAGAYRPSPVSASKKATPRGRGANHASSSGKSTPSRARGPPAKGRKRARAGSASAESDVVDGPNEPPPTKRTRGRASAPAPTPASERVLRSRRDKSVAQLQQEREQDEAYRRAIED